MKMTRAEWSYLQKIALDHPYYDTHRPPLTEAEARTIAAEHGGMTGAEFVDSVYAQLGLHRPVKEKKRFDALRSIAALFTVPPIRKIIIAVLVAVLAAAFLAATPAGRSIAESVIHYLVKATGGDLIFYQSSEEPAAVMVDGIDRLPFDCELSAPDEDDPAAKQTTSFDAFARETGNDPLVLSLPCSELYYSKTENALALYATYHAPDGPVVTCQVWNADGMVVSSMTSDFSSIASNDTVYGTIEQDGSVVCVKNMGDSVLTICSDGAYCEQDLLGFLSGK